MSDRIRVLVADRTPTRLGIRLAIGGEVDICAEASIAEQAIEAAGLSAPDVCLVGREIPGDGLVAVRGICRVAPSAAVVVLADDRNVGDMLEAVHAGAVGYIPGGVKPEQLITVVRAVHQSEAAFPRSVVLDLLRELRVTGTEGLTTRESQVLRMVRRGHSTTAIGTRLGIAPVTVRRHISELVRKLGVDDRAGLIDAADNPTTRSLEVG
jgi:DNA-binding NarL/FixJ family response regulator